MTSPPRMAAALLTLLLPPVLRDAVIGDLAEEHEVQMTAHGRQSMRAVTAACRTPNRTGWWC